MPATVLAFATDVVKPVFTRSRRAPTLSFLIDTFRIPDTGKYVPAAVTFLGKSRVEAIQWKDEQFETGTQADRFVREHFADLRVPEMLTGENTAFYR